MHIVEYGYGVFTEPILQKIYNKYKTRNNKITSGIILLPLYLEGERGRGGEWVGVGHKLNFENMQFPWGF